ncbi:hypothetical protein NA78x_003612 [Anatilimnocola sp. NA78]|uniref:hypothetical protein n=1 Tax=Anatilimnocola sp. NA78 TaxID=3415683 RepID=UPI003CE4BD8C
MPNQLWKRRDVLAVGLAAGAATLVGDLPMVDAADAPTFKLATFAADVTPPIGHPLIAGLRPPAKTIGDRLTARGIVLLGSDQPLIIAALDWCELRNQAYDDLRDALAKAAGTTRERVLLTCIHQHDAPYVDLAAQKLLDEAGLKDAMHLPEFWEATKKNLAEAVSASLAKAVPVTHLGLGEATVEGVACNRRVVAADGTPKFNRYSFTADKYLLAAPDGLIDPKLRTLAFFHNDKPIAALSLYATHPMSYYGRGEVSYDFPGIARDLWQRENPDVFGMYISGCSGDVVAAKYNDGTPAGRAALAQQLKQGMDAAWKSLERVPLKTITFRNTQLDLSPPTDGKLDPKKLAEVIADPKQTNAVRIDAAMGLSYYHRCQRGQQIDVPLIDFGSAAYLVLPAEMFVGYSLAAQEILKAKQPNKRLLVAGFGECAPGYIPTKQARTEGFAQEHGYCWVKEDAPVEIDRLLKQLLP